MRTRTLGWIVAVAAAGCASPKSWTAEATGRRDPEVRRREREIARLSAERDTLRRAEAERLLAGVATLPDAARRRRAVADALLLDPHALFDREPAEIAAVAPDVLRVYDLASVLDDGPDVVRDAPPDDEHDREVDGGGRLLARIAAGVRAAVADGQWDGGAAVIVPVGDCLAVLQAPDQFPAVERALDRAATVGGGAVRVVATAWRTPAEARREPLEVLWQEPGSATALAPDAKRLSFDVPWNRRRSAWDGIETSFVQDYAFDFASGFADPLVGSLREGLTVTGTLAAGADGAPTLAVEVVCSETQVPMPEYTTNVVDGEDRAVRVQVPELRAARAQTNLALPAERRIATVAFATWTVAVDIDPQGVAANSARPGWRRVDPSIARWTPAADEPLLDNAVRLADAHLDASRTTAATAVLREVWLPETPGSAEIDRLPGAAEALREGALVSQGRRWTRRIRLGPDATKAVLVRRPVDRPKDEVLAAIEAANVKEAKDFGFVDVANGGVVACIDEDSLGALTRALGTVDRAPRGDPGVRIAALHVRPLPEECSAAPGGGLTCTSATNYSYVRDFDLEIADDAVLADPVIAILHNGATVTARPVPSAPAGTYDVTITHSVAERPMAVFETQLAAGPPVSLQLPRLHERSESFRVALAEHETFEASSIVRLGETFDERRFAVTRE